MNNEGDLTTQPTASAIMDRLQNVEARLAGEIDALGSRMEKQMLSLKDEMVTLKDEMSAVKGEMVSLQGEMVTLKDEMSSVKGEMVSFKGEVASHSDLFKTKIDVLTEDVLSVRAGQKAILKRMNELEVKTT